MDAKLQRQLAEGIAAIRAGDRARGRELLLAVVAADERVEPAWLWLAAAVEDPADRLTALENALALNPHNQPAREALAKLQLELGLPQPPPPAPPPEPPPAPPRPTPPPSTFSAVDPDDDPLQCPFCGQLTAPDEERCPHCRRNLLVGGRWQGGGYLYWLLFLLGLNVQGAIVQAALPFAAAALRSPLMDQILGWLHLGDGLLSVPWAVLLIRAGLLLGVLGLFLNDVPWAFPVGAAVFTLDVVVNGLALNQAWAPDGPLWFNLGFSGVLLVITTAGSISQGLARDRLFTRLDRQVYGAVSFYQRGRVYARRGLLALAALHFERALRLQPREPVYYKALADAQARLGRLVRARQTLQAGQVRAPEDPEFPALLAALENADPAPQQR